MISFWVDLEEEWDDCFPSHLLVVIPMLLEVPPIFIPLNDWKNNGWKNEERLMRE